MHEIDVIKYFVESLKLYLRRANYEEWLQDGTCRLENIEDAIDEVADAYYQGIAYDQISKTVIGNRLYN